MSEEIAPHSVPQRFEVPVTNPLVIWDSVAENVIHLGSKMEAVELCQLLNHLNDEAELLLRTQATVEKQTKTILRLTAKLDDMTEKLFAAFERGN